MSSGDKRAKKTAYFERVHRLFSEYNGILVVSVDNVRSKQIQQIRRSVRGRAEILMGKNTLIRRALRQVLEENPHYQNILDILQGNIGFVFTHEDLTDIRDILLSNRVPAPARAGGIAPVDVIVPAGNTGMPPEKTSFFQALKINTKINRGTVEIVADVQVINQGDKVGPSEAALLQMLNISPFSFGMVVEHVVEEGVAYPASVLDISTEDIVKFFKGGIANVASLSLALGLPNSASVPHMFMNGYKNVLAIAVATEITFSYAETVKEMIANPDAFAAAAPAAGGSAAAAAAPVEEEEAEEEEEEDIGAGGLFGGDSDDDF